MFEIKITDSHDADEETVVNGENYVLFTSKGEGLNGLVVGDHKFLSLIEKYVKIALEAIVPLEHCKDNEMTYELTLRDSKDTVSKLSLKAVSNEQKERKELNVGDAFEAYQSVESCLPSALQGRTREEVNSFLKDVLRVDEQKNVKAND